MHQETCLLFNGKIKTVTTEAPETCLIFNETIMTVPTQAPGSLPTIQWQDTGSSDRSTITVSKGAKIKNRHNQVPQLTQDTNGKETNSQLDTTNESQEVSPFPAGDHKAHINRRPQRQSKHKTEKNIKDPQKKYRLGTIGKIFYWRA